MNFSKRGGKNNNENSSQYQADDNNSNSSRPRNVIQASVSGRSPTNVNRNREMDKSTHESGPEIQYIDNDYDRRNPMMDMKRSTENNFMNQGERGGGAQNVNRSSILTNLKNDVENPSSNYREKTRESKKNKHVSNPRTIENSESENSHVSDIRRNNFSQGTNSIVKKMSPNRNNDMNMDTNNANDQNKKNFVRKLSIIADKNKNIETKKSEFSVDTKTRENMKKKYNNDLEAIKAMDLKQNNFKMNKGNVVSKNPSEGKLYSRNTILIPAMTQKQIDEQKQNIKSLNKLSTVLIRDNKSTTPTRDDKSIKNNYKEFTEKTLKKAGSSSATKRGIRSTMSMLRSGGPNADDKIITRQMRFEKGGVVDLAMNPSQNRSAPKKTEVKRTVLRSPKTNVRENKISVREKEKSAQIIQGWWRLQVKNYKDIVDKTVIIQKNWRRFFVRKHLYDKLSYYYYFLFIVNKLENVFRTNLISYGFNKLYELNADEYDAKKFLMKIIQIQRAWRLLKKKREARKVKKTDVQKKALTGQRRRIVNGDDTDENNDNNEPKVLMGANKPNARTRRNIGNDDNDDDNALVGANKAKGNNKNVDDDEMKKKYNDLRNTNFRNVMMNLVYKFNNQNVTFFLQQWRKRAQLLDSKDKNEEKEKLNKKTNGINNEKYQKVVGTNAKNIMRKILNRKLFNAFNKWVKSTLSARKQNNLKPLLQKLLNRTNLNLKFINLSHFFNHWRNASKNNKLDEFRTSFMNKFLKNSIRRRNNKKLLKKFLLWANLAKSGRTKDQNDSIVEKEKKQLEAASHLVPLLANICKKNIARQHGEGIINILKNKSKYENLRKFINTRPYFCKYNLKKYFDRFQLRIAQDSGNNLKQKILKDTIRKYMNKNKNEVLKRKLRQWWRSLTETQKDNPVAQINAVDQLKKALQRRYIKHPINLFKSRINADNYDWAGRFALTMKRKTLKGTLREYINRWRNNQLDSMVRENMIKFYSTTLMRFNKRYVLNILRKRFNQWKNNNQLVGNSNRNNNIKLFVRNTDYYLGEKSKNDKIKFMEELLVKKKNKKYAVALDIMTGLYFSNDRKKVGQYFRRWRLNYVKLNLETMTYRLLSKIMNNMIGVNDNLNTREKLQKYFDLWKKHHERKTKSINDLNGFMNRVFHSALFHKKHIRNYIDDLYEFAKHFNLINKKKAQKLGDFLSGILKVYARIKLLKRQKILMETFKKFTFLDRMKILSACNKWKNRTSVIANHEHATILQDFIRKITDSENNKDLVTKKAQTSMDNFAKRFVLHKMADTAKLNRIYKILVGLFDSIPKELRKKALMTYCIRWNRYADIIKRNAAAEMIIKCLKGWIARRFALKLLLKKYKREDIARRMFRFLVGQKLFYYSEWKRRARILELKQNSSAMGIWMSKKFNGFKLLKSRRGLGELFQKYFIRIFIDTFKAAAKVDPHRDQKLVDAINKVYRNPPAKKVFKSLKLKYFRKKYGQVFGLLTRKLRHLHVYYYANFWRDKVMDYYHARLIRIQSWVRMVLARLKAKRELRKLKLTAKFFRKLGLDGNMAIMMYINIWRAFCRYKTLSQEGEILSKLILFHNANVDYDKDVAQNRLQAIFKGYFVKMIKDGFVDARNYKDAVCENIKNLNSLIEKQYAVNNLVDYGKDSTRRMMLQMIFGVNDKLADKSKLRQAIERWRFYNEKLIQFVIRIQTIWRGKKIRDRMKKLWKVKDIMIKMLISNFGDKDQIRARTIMWRNRAINLAITSRSNIIQNFLKTHMVGNAKKNLNTLFNNGYRKHFVKCISNLCRFKKLKDAMSRPWNRQSMEVINRRALNHKLQERFRYIIGFSDINNREWIIKEIIKKWNLNAQRIKEHERFSALLIVAAIRSKLTKIKIQRFKELKSSMRMLLFKAFGDQNAMKNFAITQWLNYTRKRMLVEAREKITNHAKGILQKISDNKNADRKARYLKAQEIIKKYLCRILLSGHFGVGLQNTRNNKLRNLDDIYRNVYKRNIREGYNRIKWFGIYKENLIKKIQRRWRFYLKFQNLLKKFMIAKLLIKLAEDGDLQKKHSHMLFWRKQVHIMNSIHKGNILQNFYRNIMDHLRKKKHGSISNLGQLFRKNILQYHLIGPLKEFNKFNKLANIENIFRSSHLRFLNEKTLLLYIMRLILGFFNKCENKVKQSAMFKFRYNALYSRDKAAKGRILNCLKEVSRRRHENKIREIMVKLVKGRSYDDKEIRNKFYCDWSRKAEFIKTKQQVDIISIYLAKQKRLLALHKKWMDFGQRIAAHNGIYGTRYVLDQADKLRRISPIVKIIYRRNTALNGDDFINRLRSINILKLLKKSFAPLMGEKDDYAVEIHAKHWNNQSQKLLRREQLLIKLGDNLQNNFNFRAFNILMSALKFKYHAKLGEIVQKHNVLSKLKSESDHVKNIQGFTNCLVKAQGKIFGNSAFAFREKLFKMYVYKILMNMGANFLKQQQANKLGLFKTFFDKFNSIYNPYKTYCKTFINILQPINDRHNKKIRDRVNNVLAFLILERTGKQNYGRTVMNKLRETYTHSSNKAKLYTILRHGYLKRQLSILPDANTFLIYSYLSQLYTKNVIARKIKKISKGFKEWRYKNQNITLAEEKTAVISKSMEKFSQVMKEELITGENGLIRQFTKYQDPEIIKYGIINKFKNAEGKKYVKNLNEKSNKLRTMRTQNHNTIHSKGEDCEDYEENDENSEENNKSNFQDTGRETLVQAKQAKNNLKK